MRKIWIEWEKISNFYDKKMERRRVKIKER